MDLFTCSSRVNWINKRLIIYVPLLDQIKRKVNLNHLPTQSTTLQIQIIMNITRIICLVASGKKKVSREVSEKT